jgi:hypothetical protein
MNDTLKTFQSFESLQFSLDSPDGYGLSSINKDSVVSSNSSRISLLANAIKITPQLFPSLSVVFETAISKLNIQANIECFVIDSPESNAFCLSMNGDVDALLLLTSRMIELLNENELSFVVGHEIGHFIFKHNYYPSVTTGENGLRELNILELSRASEISADRIGFLCGASIEDVIRGMIKIASGLPDKYIRFDVSSYLNQLREIKSLGGNESESYRTHPMLSLRTKALLWFSMSQLYYDFLGTNKNASINRKTLDKMICSDLLSVSGFHVGEIKNDVFNTTKMWATLSLFLVDRIFSKEEQALLNRMFGSKESEKAIQFIRDNGRNAPDAINEKLDEAYSSAINLSNVDRERLILELENIISSSGGGDSNAVEKLTDIAKRLNINRKINIQPWSFRNQ